MVKPKPFIQHIVYVLTYVPYFLDDDEYLVCVLCTFIGVGFLFVHQTEKNSKCILLLNIKCRMTFEMRFHYDIIKLVFLWSSCLISLYSQSLHVMLLCSVCAGLYKRAQGYKHLCTIYHIRSYEQLSMYSLAV